MPLCLCPCSLQLFPQLGHSPAAATCYRTRRRHLALDPLYPGGQRTHASAHVRHAMHTRMFGAWLSLSHAACPLPPALQSAPAAAASPPAIPCMCARKCVRVRACLQALSLGICCGEGGLCFGKGGLVLGQQVFRMQQPHLRSLRSVQLLPHRLGADIRTTVRSVCSDWPVAGCYSPIGPVGMGSLRLRYTTMGHGTRLQCLDNGDL